jgi:hypothetical protein
LIPPKMRGARELFKTPAATLSGGIISLGKRDVEIAVGVCRIAKLFIIFIHEEESVATALSNFLREIFGDSVEIFHPSDKSIVYAGEIGWSAYWQS